MTATSPSIAYHSLQGAFKVECRPVCNDLGVFDASLFLEDTKPVVTSCRVMVAAGPVVVIKIDPQEVSGCSLNIILHSDVRALSARSRRE